IVRYAIILILIAIGGWLLGFSRSFISGRINQRLLYDMRNRVFDHLEKMDVAYVNVERTGKIISLIISDIGSIGEVTTSGAIEVMINSLTLISSLYVMLNMHIGLSLAIVSIVPLMLIISGYLAKKTKQAYRLTREKLSELTSSVEQSVSGSRVSQSFVERKNIDFESFDKLSSETMKANIKARIAFAMVQPSLDTIRAISYVILILYGGNLVTYGEMSIGALIAFFGYTEMFYRPIITLTTFYSTLQAALAAAERVYLFMQVKPVVGEPVEAKWIEIKSGRIELRNIFFDYDNNPVFQGLNFKVEPGEIVAIVGPTGAGKTTLTNLIMRLYDPKAGEVLIDGHNVKEFSFKSIRKQMALVPQEPVLFNETVLENIRLGNPDASDEEVKKVVSELGLDELINRLPQKYDTVISIGGGNLSVGQRQLISFARAMLKNPKILILDEATSSLDSYTESLLQEAMIRLIKGRTCIIVAHRLSTVKLANRIVFLENGRIIEEGTHDELLSKKGAYAKLYELQFGIAPEIVSKTSVN
ncbi:MAG: ABC transporter ATP-binding protein/permease, partial [Crenarchaeota archaeon]|nr:ABC transporter ATP-binding protein/permease [Thermoproteota archaeon]MDW8034700.1 ABC transporter ATP-binding protein [Nitrososphaerota archaeon]